MINNTTKPVSVAGRLLSVWMMIAIAVATSTPIRSVAQVNCTGNVPTFTLDFTGQPAGTWISPPLIREGNCCGTQSPDRCLRIEVTADTGTAAISFQIVSGAVPPGALFYQIDCGPQTQVGQYTCITGNGVLTFCKPGNNTNTYQVTAIPKPRFPGDDTVRFGCSKTVQLLGFRDDSVQINSIFPGAIGQYNSYLSCTTGCSNPLVSPGPNAPPYVDYLVSGYPTADLCGYNVRLTDTVRIYFFPGLEATVSPSPATFCPSSPGTTLTAGATGGAGSYTYTWYNGSTVISNTNTYFATGAGNFRVIVQDALFTSCPADTVAVPVTLANIAIATTVTNATCFNFTNGTATANVTGGSAPFSYRWFSGATVIDTNQTATNLPVGNYSVTVTDAGGCANTTTVEITDPPALTITPLTITNVGCNGESNGALEVDVNGGTQ
ncbi:MAG: SprB repeat-containing protein, partial [Bacteroidota bacterium]